MYQPATRPVASAVSAFFAAALMLIATLAPETISASLPGASADHVAAIA